MKNKIPKTVQAWLDKNADKVQSYHLEDDGYSDDENSPYSIWCYLKPEWVVTDGRTSIHAATAKNFFSEVKSLKKRILTEEIIKCERL